MDALVTYSDACTLPSLTPSCPFFRDAESGPTCDEECRQLIEEFGVANRGVREVTVGGLVLTGRALPLSAAGGYSPYDASKIFLRDRGRPPRQQCTASLLLGLQAAMLEPPLLGDRNEREGRVRALWVELERRKLPVGRVMKAVVLPAIAAMIGAFATLPAMRSGGLLPPDVSTEAMDSISAFADTGWAAALDGAIAAEGGEVIATRAALRSLHRMMETKQWSGWPEDFLGPRGSGSHPTDEQIARFLNDERCLYGQSLLFTDRIYAWLCRLLDEDDLDRLLSWEAPKVDLFLAIPRQASADVDEVGGWIWDRLAVTDLGEWLDSSLHLEWRHRSGDELPVPPNVWRERVTDPGMVAGLVMDRLGNRAVRRERKGGLDPNEFVEKAVELLKENRVQEAANIFEGLLELRPADGTALNNLGFCLLPIDPVRGLELLQRASLFRPSSPLINSANRVMALSVVGRTDSARALAQEVVGTWGPHAEAEHGWLWQRSAAGEFQLVSVDPRVYLRDAAAGQF
jgi:hypothetical protein